MAADRHSKAADFLEPDAKSQVTLAFENGRPVRATALVVSTQHSAALSNAEGQKKLRDYAKGVMTDVLPQGWMPSDENIYVNPTGLFEIGGPDGDAGLTGRKIIVDTYGGADRKSVVEGKSVSVRVDIGCRRSLKKKKEVIQNICTSHKT